MKLTENYETEMGNTKLDNWLARLDQSQKAWMQEEPEPNNSLQLRHDVLPFPDLLPSPAPVPIHTPNLLHPHLVLVR